MEHIAKKNLDPGLFKPPSHSFWAQARQVELVFLLVTVEIICQLARIFNLFQFGNGCKSKSLNWLHPFFWYADLNKLIIPIDDFLFFGFHLREISELGLESG